MAVDGCWGAGLSGGENESGALLVSVSMVSMSVYFKKTALARLPGRCAHAARGTSTASSFGKLLSMAPSLCWPCGRSVGEQG